MRIERAIPATAVAGTRYDEHQMKMLDSERGKAPENGRRRTAEQLSRTAEAIKSHLVIDSPSPSPRHEEKCPAIRKLRASGLRGRRIGSGYGGEHDYLFPARLPHRCRRDGSRTRRQRPARGENLGRDQRPVDRLAFGPYKDPLGSQAAVDGRQCASILGLFHHVLAGAGVCSSGGTVERFCLLSCGRYSVQHLLDGTCATACFAYR